MKTDLTKLTLAKINEIYATYQESYDCRLYILDFFFEHLLPFDFLKENQKVYIDNVDDFEKILGAEQPHLSDAQCAEIISFTPFYLNSNDSLYQNTISVLTKTMNS